MPTWTNCARRAHFTAMLIQIESSPLASAQIKAGVARIRREWEPYQQALFASREPTKMRGDSLRVAELSERVLAVTEELVVQLVAQAQGATLDRRVRFPSSSTEKRGGRYFSRSLSPKPSYIAY